LEAHTVDTDCAVSHDTAVLAELCVRYYGSSESRAPELRLWLVSQPRLPYIIWAGVILGAGLLDLWLSFKPLSTFLVGVLTGVAYLYRHIIRSYVRIVEVRRRFIAVSVAAIALNLATGFLLNSRVDSRAEDFIARLDDYREKHGEFPHSLLEVTHDGEQRELGKNRLFLGAHVAYQSDGRTFQFSYDRYPVGEWAWNPRLRKFQPSLD
jgi:hypothetical protein